MASLCITGQSWKKARKSVLRTECDLGEGEEERTICILLEGRPAMKTTPAKLCHFAARDCGMSQSRPQRCGKRAGGVYSSCGATNSASCALLGRT
uniref:Uncharacterized protein n=1 Tax=Tetraselmis sp. GSL018 TaxID=582737 RepID=A0A061RP36_9CHLO